MTVSAQPWWLCLHNPKTKRILTLCLPFPTRHLTVSHGCTRQDVAFTVVDGQVLVENGVLALGREAEMEIVANVKKAAKGILERCNEGDARSIGGKLGCGWSYV
jgi:hypothetical protein